MKSKQLLTRLQITGVIHNNTPLCVLLEIADAHGIKYDLKDSIKPGFTVFLLESIARTEMPVIKDHDNTIEELQHIARFINKHHPWPQNKLIQAYNFLMQFTVDSGTDLLTKLSDNFVIGLQTPELPITINACVLYQICTVHRLAITNHTTLQQLGHAVKLLRMDAESILRRTRTFIERDAKRLDLINVLLLANHDIADSERSENIIVEQIHNYYNNRTCNISHAALSLIRQGLTDIRSLQSRIDPGTEQGAVALGAINYSIDLSTAQSALREYKILKMTTRDTYQPADSWMAYWYARNTSIFDLLLTFNPTYPIEFYTREQLAIIAENEGYNSTELVNSDITELLQLSYVSHTFYEGPWPNLEILETPIDMDEVDDVLYGELLSYGCMNGTMNPITIKELTEWFRQVNNFTTPFTKQDSFSTSAINKLKLILQRVPNYRRGSTAIEQTIVRRASLLQIIDFIEGQLKYSDEPTKQLLKYYHNADANTKLAIITCITELMNLGMYMRGWDGKSNNTYPIKNAPVPTDGLVKISIVVSQAIQHYESTIISLGTIGKFINILPLVRYKNGQYQASTNVQDGFTIRERIDIVKTGENSVNVSSCIRLSSNWLCGSAHKYLEALGTKQCFDIFHLAHIS